MSPRRPRDHDDEAECPDCGAPLLQCLCDVDLDDLTEDDDDTEELDFDEEG